jgi:transcriptional regulator with XRE-family HTH domain
MSDRDTEVNGPPDPRHGQDYRRLRWRRFAAGLSLTDAAKAAGVTKSHLSKLEHDADPASPGLLKKLADIYGCKISDLMQPDPGTAGEVPKVPAEVAEAAALWSP